MTATRPAHASPERATRSWLTLAAVSAGSAVVALDGTVVAVANPAIAADLSPSLTQLQWITNAYLLAIAATLVVIGRAADLVGRRRIWLGGVVLFTAASLAIGLAGSAESVIAWRAVQGLAGAMIMPAGVGLLRDAYTGPALSRALGVWSTVIGGAAAAGPVVAGILVDAFGWQAVFFINVPVGIAAVALGSRLPPSAQRWSGVRRLDLVGSFLLAGAMVAAAWAVLGVEHSGAGLGTAAWTGAVALLAGLFALWQRRISHPLVDPSVWRDRTVACAALLVVIAFLTLYGVLFLVTLYTQRVLGASSVQTGLQILPLTIALATTSMLAGRVNARHGPRPALLVGMAALTLATAGLSFLTPTSPYGALLPSLLGIGVGIGLVSVASTDALLGSIDPRHGSVAGGIQQTASQLGGVLGTALLATLVSVSVSSGLPDALDRRGLEAPLVQQVVAESDLVAQGGVPEPALAEGPDDQGSVRSAAHEVYVDGMNLATLLTAGLGCIGFLLALAVRRGRHAAGEHAVVVPH